MINQLMEKITEEISVTQDFNKEDLVIVTTTKLGNRVLHVHEFELTEIYEAFAAKLNE